MRYRFYVYMLLDNEQPFYVGKGKGARVGDHEREARRGRNNAKCAYIRAVWESGGQIGQVIVFETNDEQEALDYERVLISQIGLGNLTNERPGGAGKRSDEHRGYWFQSDAIHRLGHAYKSLTTLAADASISQSHLAACVRGRFALGHHAAWRVASVIAKGIVQVNEKHRARTDHHAKYTMFGTLRRKPRSVQPIQYEELSAEAVFHLLFKAAKQ